MKRVLIFVFAIVLLSILFIPKSSNKVSATSEPPDNYQWNLKWSDDNTYMGTYGGGWQKVFSHDYIVPATLTWIRLEEGYGNTGNATGPGIGISLFKVYDVTHATNIAYWEWDYCTWEVRYDNYNVSAYHGQTITIEYWVYSWQASGFNRTGGMRNFRLYEWSLKSSVPAAPPTPPIIIQFLIILLSTMGGMGYIMWKVRTVKNPRSGVRTAADTVVVFIFIIVMWIFSGDLATLIGAVI